LAEELDKLCGVITSPGSVHDLLGDMAGWGVGLELLGLFDSIIEEISRGENLRWDERDQVEICCIIEQVERAITKLSQSPRSTHGQTETLSLIGSADLRIWHLTQPFKAQLTQVHLAVMNMINIMSRVSLSPSATWFTVLNTRFALQRVADNPATRQLRAHLVTLRTTLEQLQRRPSLGFRSAPNQPLPDWLAHVHAQLLAAYAAFAHHPRKFVRPWRRPSTLDNQNVVNDLEPYLYDPFQPVTQQSSPLDSLGSTALKLSASRDELSASVHELKRRGSPTARTH
jgi:hypothetical protein